MVFSSEQKRQQIVDYLQKYSMSRISELYDNDVAIVAALHYLMPNLEYLDISHLTIAEFLKKVAK